MPSEDHLSPFLEAMHEGDTARAHLSDTIELNSPILPTRFKGRANVTDVLAELLSTIDTFDRVHSGEDGRIETRLSHGASCPPSSRHSSGSSPNSVERRCVSFQSTSRHTILGSRKRPGGRPDARMHTNQG